MPLLTSLFLFTRKHLQTLMNVIPHMNLSAASSGESYLTNMSSRWDYRFINIFAIDISSRWDFAGMKHYKSRCKRRGILLTNMSSRWDYRFINVFAIDISSRWDFAGMKHYKSRRKRRGILFNKYAVPMGLCRYETL